MTSFVHGPCPNIKDGRRSVGAEIQELLAAVVKEEEEEEEDDVVARARARRG